MVECKDISNKIDTWKGGEEGGGWIGVGIIDFLTILYSGELVILLKGSGIQKKKN